MKNLVVKTDPRVESKFQNYPPKIRPKMGFLRQLVLETAAETEGITAIEETLKWGEPSFLVKKGSTLRMDWKAKKPEQYALYFKCTSKLVQTIKAVYGDTFRYEKNRAVLFGLDDEIPVEQVKDCMAMA